MSYVSKRDVAIILSGYHIMSYSKEIAKNTVMLVREYGTGSNSYSTAVSVNNKILTTHTVNDLGYEVNVSDTYNEDQVHYFESYCPIDNDYGDYTDLCGYWRELAFLEGLSLVNIVTEWDYDSLDDFSILYGLLIEDYSVAYIRPEPNHTDYSTAPDDFDLGYTGSSFYVLIKPNLVDDFILSMKLRYGQEVRLILLAH